MTDSPPPAEERPPSGYEFTPDQSREIAAVGGAFWVVGLIVGIQVVKQVYRAGVGAWHLANGDAGASWIPVAERVALVLFLAPLAYWLFRASASFSAIAETAGRDIDHLMDGLRSIRWSFGWVCVALVVALLLGLAVVVAAWFR